jgi:hypothetical protein
VRERERERERECVCVCVRRVKKQNSHGARSHGLGSLASQRPLLEGCGELDEQLFGCFMVLRMLRKSNGPEQSAVCVCVCVCVWLYTVCVCVCV